jgi:hypothetical protein
VVNDDGREEDEDPGEGDEGNLGLVEIDVSAPEPIVATDPAVTAPGTRFSSSP